MERMIVNTDKGLHPTVDIALNDVETRASHSPNNFRLVGTEGKIPVEKPVEMHRMKDRVTVSSFNIAPGCQYCDVWLKLAIPVVKDEL